MVDIFPSIICICFIIFTKKWNPFLFQVSGGGLGGGGPIMGAMRVSARRHEIVRVNNEFLLRPNFLQKAEKEVSYSLFSLLYSIPWSGSQCVYSWLLLVHEYCSLFTSWIKCSFLFTCFLFVHTLINYTLDLWWCENEI